MRSETKHVVVDARMPQVLEPLRVPTKLHDRLDKAHKRIITSKEGYHFSSAATPPRESTKKNLPDVILRNKLLAFESKWQCTTKTSVLYDPLDTTFERLSIEEREEVMNRIHTRVEAITEAVEAKYRRKKQDLDDQGIFDPEVNARRVQTMYLVELQRRCNLDAIKAEVLSEMERESAAPLSFDGSFGRPSNPINVLGSLLKDVEQTPQDLKGAQKLQRLLRNMNKSTSEPTLKEDVRVRRASIASAASVAPSMRALPLASQVASTGPGNQLAKANSRLDERQVLFSRHPEIAAVIHALRSPEDDDKRQSSGDGKASQAVEEWNSQALLFEQIGARLNAELRRRTESYLIDQTAPDPMTPAQWSQMEHLSKLMRAKKLTIATDDGQIEASDEQLKVRKDRTHAQYMECQDAISRRRLRRQLADLNNGTDTPEGVDAMPTDPQELQRRPSTILNDRVRKVVQRKPSVVIGLIGKSRGKSNSPIVRHTTKRMVKRRESALSWEWLPPNSTTESRPPETKPHREPPARTSSSLPDAPRAEASPSPHQASRVHRHSVILDSRESLQRRLEAVWTQLAMPYHLKLNMLEKYASHDGAEALHSAISLWESAADAVVLRETLLAMAVKARQDLVQTELDVYWSQLENMATVQQFLPRELQSTSTFGRWVSVDFDVVSDSRWA
ncbi:hypothetical protein AC1031_007278 [Aphanomyces cochlioides]|nr:hypothetical protein AC1031_007278 [Aphanomyces cochlioides]